MNIQLRKEIRALFWPAVLVALCVAVSWMRLLLPASGIQRQLIESALGLAGFGFFAGVMFLAAMPFGAEFQQRTFVLLLSQPAERFRIWWGKLFVAAALIVPLSLVQLAAAKVTGLSERDAFWWTAGVSFVCVTAFICSTGYWTLIARSTIGGVVFSALIMFLGGALLMTILEKIFGPIAVVVVNSGRDTGAHFNIVIVSTLVAAGLLYSAGCLWLGWRKFAALELRDTQSGNAISFPKNFPGARWFGKLLRPRPNGALRNLIRKELRLQRPIFMFAVFFCGGWFVLQGYSLLFPTTINRQEVFVALSIIYLLFPAVLIGPSAFDEEKTLGLAAWHLTLPPSARRQWLAKFGVAVAVFVLLGVYLPTLLALTIPTAGRDHLNFLTPTHDAARWWAIYLLLFVLSFWAASLTGNIVRAILTAIITCFGLGAGTALAHWVGEQSGGLQTGLLRWLVVRLGLPPDKFAPQVDLWDFWLFVGVGLLVALFQSARNFRRARTCDGIPWKQPLAFAIVLILAVAWASDFQTSARKCSEGLIEDFKRVVETLRLTESDFPPPGHARGIKLEKFEDPQKPIPSYVKSLLSHAEVSLFHNREFIPSRSHSGRAPEFSVRIEWINGNVSYPYHIAWHFPEKSVPIIPKNPK